MGGNPIKIGSFNMNNFWNADKKDIQTIAKIISTVDFDILAMQELFREDAVTQLMLELGSNWTWRPPEVNRGSGKIDEGSIFIWKKSKFQLATGRRSESDFSLGASKVSVPDIWRQYPKDPILTGGRLVRDPFYIRLESLQGWYEIRLINTHIMFSQKNIPESQNIEKRQKEFQALTNIYCRLSDQLYRSGRPSYTFLLGDYNLNLPGIGKSKAYIPEHCNPMWKYKNGRLRKQVITLQDKLSTLGYKENASGQRIWEFANNYDHFTFDKLRFEGMRMPVCDRIDTVQGYYGGDFEQHKTKISDHIPIYLQFSLTDRP